MAFFLLFYLSSLLNLFRLMSDADLKVILEFYWLCFYYWELMNLRRTYEVSLVTVTKI